MGQIAHADKKRCLNAGMTAQEAAAELGCSVRNINLWAKTHGFSWKPAICENKANQPIPNEPHLRMLWQGHLTMDAMARAAGYSVSGMIKAARRYGWGERPAQRARREAKEARALRPAAAPAAPDVSTVTGRLLATGGRYAALAQIAADLGWSAIKAQQKYHRACFAARTGSI